MKLDILLACDCGNRDSVTAPLRALPSCSAGCGATMFVAGSTLIVPGPEVWRLGRGDAVVSNVPQRPSDDIRDRDYYGGYLVAESIPSRAKAALIASAPQLLRECRHALRYIETTPWHCATGLTDKELAPYDFVILNLRRAIASAEDVAGERA